MWGDERIYIYHVDISALYIYNCVDIGWKTRIGPNVDMMSISSYHPLDTFIHIVLEDPWSP